MSIGPLLQEFHPYVFQIFSQLIELRPPPLTSTYLDLLRPLLTPMLWERPGNIPALVRLTSAYLSKAAQQIVQANLLPVSRYSCSISRLPLSLLRPVGSRLKNMMMQGILGIFQKLVAGKAHDHDGLRLLEAIVDNVPPETFDAYLPEVYFNLQVWDANFTSAGCPDCSLLMCRCGRFYSKGCSSQKHQSLWLAYWYSCPTSL